MINLNAWQRAVLLGFAAAITFLQVEITDYRTKGSGWVVGFATAAGLALLGLSRRRSAERETRSQINFNVWQRMVLLGFAVAITVAQLNIINYSIYELGPGWVVGLVAAAAFAVLGLSRRRFVEPLPDAAMTEAVLVERQAPETMSARPLGRRAWLIGAAVLLLSSVVFAFGWEMSRRAAATDPFAKFAAPEVDLDAEYGPLEPSAGSLADLGGIAVDPPGFVADPSAIADKKTKADAFAKVRVAGDAGSLPSWAEPDAAGLTKHRQTPQAAKGEVVIPGVARLRLPPTLEVQSAEYRRLANPMSASADENSQAGSRVVIQPKGINDLDGAALKQYCRIIVETEPITPRLQTFMASLPIAQNDLRELNELLKTGLRETFHEKMKLLRWYGTGNARVGDASGVSASYLRQLGDNAPVSVSVYMVSRGSSLVSVTLSFRESEAGVWERQLQQVVRTMTFLGR